jgi:NAD(P)-dependent dehydrogenase (short-subunit alcohol dehydrogenase family)
VHPEQYSIHPINNMAPEQLSLQGKTAIVTGSGRENGIGAAIARVLARNGASVAIHYVSESSKPSAEKVATAIAKDYDARTTVIRGAVEVPETCDRLVQETLAAFGADRIDILGRFQLHGHTQRVSG